MDKTDWFAVIAIGAGVVALTAFLYFGFTKLQAHQYNYKTACVDAGGNPIYNGKHWECLK